jgi:hypothetical protein
MQDLVPTCSSRSVFRDAALTPSRCKTRFLPVPQILGSGTLPWHPANARPGSYLLLKVCARAEGGCMDTQKTRTKNWCLLNLLLHCMHGTGGGVGRHLKTHDQQALSFIERIRLVHANTTSCAFYPRYPQVLKSYRRHKEFLLGWSWAKILNCYA